MKFDRLVDAKSRTLPNAADVKSTFMYDSDSKELMLRLPGLHFLTGAPEHSVTVFSRYVGERYERKIAPVACVRESKPIVYCWADTITGSLYDLDGLCVSGPLEFVSTPAATGRLVPTVMTRTKEVDRAALHEAYDEAA